MYARFWRCSQGQEEPHKGANRQNEVGVVRKCWRRYVYGGPL